MSLIKSSLHFSHKQLEIEENIYYQNCKTSRDTYLPLFLIVCEINMVNFLSIYLSFYHSISIYRKGKGNKFRRHRIIIVRKKKDKTCTN